MDNPTFAEEEEKEHHNPPMPPIEIPEPAWCLSWTRICDVMGNRQGVFIQALRPMKIPLVHTTQTLEILKIGLERGMRKYDETVNASENVHHLVESINTITSSSILNVPTDENEMFRKSATELSVLVRVIDQLIIEDKIYRQSLREQGLPVTSEEVSTSSPPSPTTEFSIDLRGKAVRNAASGISAVDEHSLKDRIERHLTILENLLKFVDKKTERRWWLRDVINFSQLVVKVALFISASIAVFYPAGEDQPQVFPILTLALTIAQGVIEVLDQYFLKNKTPEDIKMHVALAVANGNA